MCNEGVREQDAQENISTHERGRNRGLKKTEELNNLYPSPNIVTAIK
jgi:hypothetical protein